MQEKFKAYVGNKPFIFVSYAHKDNNKVYPIIKKLHDEGYRIWYDEGIPPTEEWRGVINRHILDCSVFMVFVTDSSMKRDEVISECTFAINKRKKLHIIYLEDVPDYAIDDNLIASFVNNQRVHKDKYSEAEFNRKLREPLGAYKDNPPVYIKPEPAANEVTTENKPTPKSEPKPEIKPASKPTPTPTEPKKISPSSTSDNSGGKRWKAPVIAIVCAVVLLAVIGVAIGTFPSGNSSNNPQDISSVPFGLKYVIVDGEATITNYTGDASSLTIPSEIDGAKVTRIDRQAFEDCTVLTKITIPDSVTEIGAYAFDGCTGLTEITIPDSVTSIGGWVFRNCTSLTEITISNSITHIGTQAFCGCTKLAEITIPDSVTSIGRYAFDGCTGLTEITIPDSVTEIGAYAFSYCTSLTEITIPDSVTEIGESAFSYCTSLTEITIPDSVTGIGWCAFDGCTSLTEIIIPDSVTGIGAYAFGGCTSLTEITIPDSVTGIGAYAFGGCTSLTEITIPDSVTGIGAYAFSGCSNLTVYAPHEASWYDYTDGGYKKWIVQ